jgi:hypothetical protein
MGVGVVALLGTKPDPLLASRFSLLASSCSLLRVVLSNAGFLCSK